MEYQKNDLVTVRIEDIGNNGEGIGKASGYTLFVKDAVIGDLVKARITKVKKQYGYARVEKVITPSPFRVEPKCDFHRQCGGCQIQQMEYAKQLACKQEKVRNNLIRIGGFAEDFIDKIMEPIVGMDDPWHYRNKAQYPVGCNKQGELVTGFYAGRTHDIIANTDCALGAKENKEILEAVLSYMRENHVSAYNEKTGNGLVRHILIRTGFASGQIMVCLVINGKKLPVEDGLVEKLRGLELAGNESPDGRVRDDSLQDGSIAKQKSTVKGENNHVRIKPVERRIVSIAVSVNEDRTNVIMGKSFRTLWGSDRIEDSIRILQVAGNAKDRDAKSEITGKKFFSSESEFVETEEQITFRISPLSFYQVNPKQMEKLYSLVLHYAGLTGKETVWDLYCGIGTISLFLARHAKQVYGVEIIPQAITDAKENAKCNGIENVSFYMGKAEEVLPALYEKISSEVLLEGQEQMRHPDVIVVDPPRKGCDEKCLETMLAMQPERIVYVSCDSATLARDLRILTDGGYELRRVRAVDQFGQTVHVETVVSLSLKKDTPKIEVSMQPEEDSLYEPKDKGTYGKIKAYILEKYGLKVSSLYIAQVKDKCGLDKQRNYKLPEKEDAHVPKCPKEKEDAIMDAFRHFGLI